MMAATAAGGVTKQSAVISFISTAFLLHKKEALHSAEIMPARKGSCTPGSTHCSTHSPELSSLTGLRAMLAGHKTLKALLVAPEPKRGYPLHRLGLHVHQVEKLAPPSQHHLDDKQEDTSVLCENEAIDEAGQLRSASGQQASIHPAPQTSEPPAAKAALWTGMSSMYQLAWQGFLQGRAPPTSTT